MPGISEENCESTIERALLATGQGAAHGPSAADDCE